MRSDSTRTATPMQSRDTIGSPLAFQRLHAGAGGASMMRMKARILPLLAVHASATNAEYTAYLVWMAANGLAHETVTNSNDRLPALANR